MHNNQSVSHLSAYPSIRMRRLRQKPFVRNLVQENFITINDLIYPVFLQQGNTIAQEIKSMPGQFRYNIDGLLKECEIITKLNIQAIALFPAIDSSLKNNNGIEATNPNGLIPNALRKIKQYFPDLGVITDIALDPYTSHGQDGILDKNNQINNDETIKILIEQALTHAASGADIVAPSDMMDGRIGQIRQSLDKHKYHDVLILAYAAKFASNYYGPFREAVASSSNLGKSTKKSYQLNIANSDEALREVALDIQEGADIVMVKPGMPYLDIIHAVSNSFSLPTFAYQVSGEYSMHKLAFMHNVLDPNQVILETLFCFKRAGASAILTYFAKDAAEMLYHQTS